MNRCITKYDALFLCELLAAFVLNELIAHLSAAVFLSLVLFGFLFETFTRFFWTYSEEFRQSIFTVHGSDVSVSAAFSWAAVILICVNLSLLIQNFVEFPYKNAVLSFLIMGAAGNVLETICAKWGMFKYEESWITRMIFFKKSIFILGVPLMVRIGYFTTFAVMCILLSHWTDRL